MYSEFMAGTLESSYQTAGTGSAFDRHCGKYIYIYSYNVINKHKPYRMILSIYFSHSHLNTSSLTTGSNVNVIIWD